MLLLRRVRRWLLAKGTSCCGNKCLHAAACRCLGRIAGDRFRRVGREAEDVAGISNGLSVDEWQSPLPRSKISRVLDSGAYINATPFAGQRVLVVGMEMQGRKSPSTVSMARRRRYQHAAGFISSRAIFGLPIQVVATVATHLLEVTAYSGSRAHAPIIGGEITIPLAARRSSCRRSASASGPSWYLGLLPLHPSGM